MKLRADSAMGPLTSAHLHALESCFAEILLHFHVDLHITYIAGRQRGREQRSVPGFSGERGAGERDAGRTRPTHSEWGRGELPDVQVQENLIFSLTRVNLDSDDAYGLKREEISEEAGGKRNISTLGVLPTLTHFLPGVPFHPAPLA